MHVNIPICHSVCTVRTRHALLILLPFFHKSQFQNISKTKGYPGSREGASRLCNNTATHCNTHATHCTIYCNTPSVTQHLATDMQCTAMYTATHPVSLALWAGIFVYFALCARCEWAMSCHITIRFNNKKTRVTRGRAKEGQLNLYVWGGYD